MGLPGGILEKTQKKWELFQFISPFHRYNWKGTTLKIITYIYLDL